MSAACRVHQRLNRTNRTRSRAALLSAGAAVAALVLSACSSGGTHGGGGDTNFVAGKDGISTVAKGSRVGRRAPTTWACWPSRPMARGCCSPSPVWTVAMR
ncbi:hypothetical protein AB0M07_43045, partial [Streptomyces sp. NPDC052015]